MNEIVADRSAGQPSHASATAIAQMDRRKRRLPERKSARKYCPAAAATPPARRPPWFLPGGPARRRRARRPAPSPGAAPAAIPPCRARRARATAALLRLDLAVPAHRRARLRQRRPQGLHLGLRGHDRPAADRRFASWRRRRGSNASPRVRSAAVRTSVACASARLASAWRFRSVCRLAADWPVAARPARASTPPGRAPPGRPVVLGEQQRARRDLRRRA